MTSFLAGGLAAGFLKSWGMILVSEIGDKTFFIAAVMAMKNSRQSVSVSSLHCRTGPSQNFCFQYCLPTRLPTQSALFRCLEVQQVHWQL